MLEDKIKAKIKEALLSRDDIAKNVLRYVLGQAQTEQARAKSGMVDSISDETFVKIIRKTIENNLETINLNPGASNLYIENGILNDLLPELWSEDDISSFLEQFSDQIKSAKSEGQAIGLAMKALKAENAPVDGKNVTVVVKKLRG